MSDLDNMLDLKSYFVEQLNSVSKNQQTDMSPFAIQYLAQLLIKFSLSQNYFLQNKEKNSAISNKDFPRLALLWLQSLEQSNFDKFFSLQKLGDTALFTSGFLGEHIEKTLVDRDYYMAMGKTAYTEAGSIQDKISNEEEQLNVFFELAANFKEFVSVFEEIAHHSWTKNNSDLLKLYKKWQHSPSSHFYRLLQEAGINPYSSGES